MFYWQTCVDEDVAYVLWEHAFYDFVPTTERSDPLMDIGRPFICPRFPWSLSPDERSISMGVL